MRSLYKTLGALTIAAAIMFGSYETADAAKRRVVVEDHTGAWCGWCVRGTQTLRELSEEYGEDFIPVAVHNGDGMAIQSIQTPLAQKIGLTGYPSGSVNRMLFSGQSKVVLSDGAWKSATQIVYDEFGEVWADIDVEWNLTPQGQLSANVTVTADADASGAYGINLFVMEDGVTGTGSGYNQQNYLSGRAGFEGHYYYDKPGVIQGYVHDNVLRDMLSGYDGKLKPINKTTIKAGDVFNELFSKNISSQIQNVDKVWVVAVIQNLSDSNFEIVNAKMAGKVLPTVAKVEIASDGEVNNRHDAGTKVTETLTVTNPNDFEITVDMSVNGTTSVIPNGWTTEFSKTALTIAAGATATTDLTLNTANTAGFAQIAVKAEARSVDDIKGKSASTNVYSLSNSSKNAFVITSNNAVPVLSSFNQMSAVMSESAIIPYSNNIANAYPFADFDLIILSTDNTNRGTLAQNGVMAGALNDALNAGKKVLLNGTIEAFFATGNPISGVNVAPEAKSLYATLGVRTYNPAGPLTISQTQSNGSISLFPTPVVAEQSDPLFSGLNFTINQYNQSSHPYYAQWVDVFAITNTTTTKSFLNYTVNGAGKDATIAGVKVTLAGGGKAILTGFGFDIIADASARTSLLSKSIEWLNAVESTAPNMILNTDVLNFGKVGEATDLDIEVSNTGNAELVIDEATISLDDDAAFTVAKYPNSVAAGAKTKITVTYTPKDGKLSTAVLRVVSNAGNKTVALSGEGVTSSVDDYLANTGLFVMNVTPNPVASQSLFQYELNSNSAENVELKLVDANGLVVANLFNGIQTPGTHTINLDANNYANGKYFIIANLLGHSAQFPVVIAK